MSTVYTINGKVLKNAANDKWLAKKEGPAGFVMDASNAVSTTGQGGKVTWESPTYPDVYNGNGKTLEVTISSDLTTGTYTAFPLFYTSTVDGDGPQLSQIDFPVTTGTHLFTIYNNPATAAGYGKYIVLQFLSDELRTANLSKISMRIID